MQLTPPASACPADARCEPVTYYVPNVTLPSAYTVTTRPDFSHTYSGLELVVRKRSSRGWMMTGSYSYNSTIEDYGSPAAYEDPTTITERNGFQSTRQQAAASVAAADPTLEGFPSTRSGSRS